MASQNGFHFHVPGDVPDHALPRLDGHVENAGDTVIYKIALDSSGGIAGKILRLPNTDPEQSSGTYKADLGRGVKGILSRNPFGFYLVGRELTERGQKALEALAGNLRDMQQADFSMPQAEKLVKDACAEGGLACRPLFIMRGLNFVQMSR